MSTTTSKPKSQLGVDPSEGEDIFVLESAAAALTSQQQPWQLCNGGKGLEKEFQFKTFKKTWAYMNDVAEQCAKVRHHPEWSNTYNRVQIRWTTHNPAGLSQKDTQMAEFCDRAAEKYS